ncbi:MAG TPA: hypothetical protein ENL38_00810, partial [Candidatus Aminicenantes bacterium]|nr:hypothetical protein [Candidatus Aminicenantes bacterium]
MILNPDYFFFLTLVLEERARLLERLEAREEEVLIREEELGRLLKLLEEEERLVIEDEPLL